MAIAWIEWDPLNTDMHTYMCVVYILSCCEPEGERETRERGGGGEGEGRERQDNYDQCQLHGLSEIC